MLKQRIVTASILVVLVVWAVLKLPMTGFGLALLAVILSGAWEWARLIGLPTIRDRLLYVSGVLVLILAIWPLLDHPALMSGLLVLTVLGWCGALLWLRRYARRPDHQDQPWSVGIAGLVVLPAPWVAFMGLRGEFGPSYVLFLFLLVWTADVGAYFAGRRWGRRKLAPAISPGKTWEGVGGAGMATLALALVGAVLLEVGSRWPVFVMVCLVTVGFSIAGDLFESMLKRQRGVKDSGSLLPGHGGVLDRVDSLTAAAPVFLLGLYGVWR
ncbi:MAG: phosphatidate cytidylyltransferase [Gammaproteobacteria bacterium]|nr:phosphatidate cytidylyltransferase [Gammaproteobacteria bacterium]MCP5195444.1 phosphatidate cytidylyltransferase [Gammaproteobacteria bacterium]